MANLMRNSNHGRIMKLCTGSIIGFFLIVSCGSGISGTKKAGDSRPELRGYIERNCPQISNCEIDLGKALDFPWDRLFVFNFRAERDAIRKVTGREFTHFSDQYTNKWIFDISGDLRIEEYPIGKIDRPFSNGDIDFDFGEINRDYEIFTKGSKFSVETIELEPGRLYRLKCLNCAMNLP